MQAIIDLARLLGWKTYHTFDSRRSEPGYPDLTLVKGRRLVFAELKTEKGRMTAAQDEWLEAFLQAGAEVCVFRPRDWHSGVVEQILREAA